MERDVPGSTPEDNPADQPAPKKKLTKALHRLGLFSGESKETGDKDKENDKSKKFRRFFKGLFKDIVEKPQRPDDTGEKPRRPRSESIFGMTVEAPDEHEDGTTVSGESLVVSDELSVLETPDEHPEVTPEAVEASEDEELEEVATPFVLPVRPDTTTAREETIYTASPAIEERRIREPAQKEVIIERRGVGIGLPVALVGLEYLARKKADKKLDARLSEKIAHVQKETEQNTQTKQELQKLVRQNEERLEALKRDRGIELARAETARPRIEKQPQARELVSKPAGNKQEALRQYQQAPAEKLSKQEVPNIVDKAPEPLEEPEKLVGRAFERKHEVRDVPAITVGATSIGSIVASRIADQQSESQSSSVRSATSVSGTDGLPIIRDDPRSGLYSNAVKNGFWAAIIIILLGVGAYLLK